MASPAAKARGLNRGSPVNRARPGSSRLDGVTSPLQRGSVPQPAALAAGDRAEALPESVVRDHQGRVNYGLADALSPAVHGQDQITCPGNESGLPALCTVRRAVVVWPRMNIQEAMIHYSLLLVHDDSDSVGRAGLHAPPHTFDRRPAAADKPPPYGSVRILDLSLTKATPSRCK